MWVSGATIWVQCKAPKHQNGPLRGCCTKCMFIKAPTAPMRILSTERRGVRLCWRIQNLKDLRARKGSYSLNPYSPHSLFVRLKPFSQGFFWGIKRRGMNNIPSKLTAFRPFLRLQGLTINVQSQMQNPQPLFPIRHSPFLVPFTLVLVPLRA